jgi:hypothetical protein
MWRKRHRLLTPGNDDVGISARDMQHAERHGAQTRTAHLVQAPSSLLLRDSRLHGGLASWILALCCGQDLPKDDFIHFMGIEFCTLQRRLDRNRTELIRGSVGECTVEGPNRRSGRRSNNDVCHIWVSLVNLSMWHLSWRALT